MTDFKAEISVITAVIHMVTDDNLLASADYSLHHGKSLIWKNKNLCLKKNLIKLDTNPYQNL